MYFDVALVISYINLYTITQPHNILFFKLIVNYLNGCNKFLTYLGIHREKYKSCWYFS